MKEKAWKVLKEIDHMRPDDWGVCEMHETNTKDYFGEIKDPKILNGRYLYVYRNNEDCLTLPDADIVVRYSENENEWIGIYEV